MTFEMVGYILGGASVISIALFGFYSLNNEHITAIRTDAATTKEQITAIRIDAASTKELIVIALQQQLQQKQWKWFWQK